MKVRLETAFSKAQGKSASAEKLFDWQALPPSTQRVSCRRAARLPEKQACAGFACQFVSLAWVGQQDRTGAKRASSAEGGLAGGSETWELLSVSSGAGALERASLIPGAKVSALSGLQPALSYPVLAACWGYDRGLWSQE